MTAEAKRIAADHSLGVGGGVGSHEVFAGPKRGARVPSASSYACHGRLAARALEKIQYGEVSQREIPASYFLSLVSQ